jgi:hypothetical protein
VAITSASAILSALDITSSHSVPVNKIGTSLVILALKSAIVDEEFHINNLGREYRIIGGSLQLWLDSWRISVLSRPGVGLVQ